MQGDRGEVEAEVGPDEHEEGKDDGGDLVEAHVVERLAQAQPGIGDVHADENGGTDHGEVDEVGPTDEPERDEVVCDELVVVLPGFLETQQHDEGLLEPKAELKQIVELEFAAHLPVRILEPKMFEVEPPAVLEAHDVEPQRSGTAPVEHGIALFGESCLLRLALDPPPLGKRFKDIERGRLTEEAKHNDVKDEEEEVIVSLLIPRLVTVCGSRDEVLECALDVVFGWQTVEDDLGLGHAMREQEEGRDGVVFGSANEKIPVEVSQNKDGGELERGSGRGHPSEGHQVLDEALGAVDFVVLKLVFTLFSGASG